MQKNTIIIAGIIVVVLIAGLIWYIAMPKTSSQLNPSPSIQNSASPSPTSGTIIDVKTDGGAAGGLVICSDSCGDGICQKTDSKCKSGDPSCICAETTKNCPADCH